MQARAEIRARVRLPRPRLLDLERTTADVSSAGILSGVLGGLAAAAAVICWDWAHSGHSALELPMAVTGWLFGLEHFEANGYRVWPIVIGALFLLVYWAVLGLAFGHLAERVYEIRRLGGMLALGAAWSVLTFLATWYMLLPVARGGEPIQATVAASGSVAPMWIWVVSYAGLGLATATAFWALRRRARSEH